MELIIALVVGLILGASMIYFTLNNTATRSRAELQQLVAELRENRHALSQAKEQIARIEASRASEQLAANEKLALLQQAKLQLSDAFKALSSEALSNNNNDFLKLAKSTLEKYQTDAQRDLAQRQQTIQQTVQPVGEALKTFNERVSQIEECRSASDASLKQQLQQLASSQTQLNQATSSLVQALRAPQVRGQWGEMQLRRTVEMAGMINYCDFTEQTTVETEAGQRQRPDMLIRLPNERLLVVDSKVPLAAYLEALQTDCPEIQIERMQAHARHVRDHIKGLSAKSYWSQFDNTPEFVVLFIPNEAIFSAALEQDPQLIEMGVLNQVILATPTTLIALLKAIAYGWQQEAIAREAKEISALGKELYQRISVVAGHFAKLGKSLDQSVSHYNTAIRSVETRLIVTAKKFEALDSSSHEKIPELSSIEKNPALPRSANDY